MGHRVVLVDVRSPGEITEVGSLDRRAVNVPLALVPAAFGDAPEDVAGLEFDWEREAGRSKPGKDHVIVVSCASGARSRRAARYLHEHGYTVCNFADGAEAWINASGPVRA
jgi:rhodanese-related sulfurtransferase